MTSDVASEKLFGTTSRKSLQSMLDYMVEPGIRSTPSNISLDEPDNSSIAYFAVKDQWFIGPKIAPYVSTCVLDPLITVERHHGKYHITARFNVESTILDYHQNKRFGPWECLSFYSQQLFHHTGKVMNCFSKISVFSI
jgi:hypothetical protein